MCVRVIIYSFYTHTHRQQKLAGAVAVRSAPTQRKGFGRNRQDEVPNVPFPVDRWERRVENKRAAARLRDTELPPAHHVAVNILDDADIAGGATASMVLQRTNEIDISDVVDEIHVVTNGMREGNLAEAEAIPRP